MLSLPHMQNVCVFAPPGVVKQDLALLFSLGITFLEHIYPPKLLSTFLDRGVPKYVRILYSIEHRISLTSQGLLD